MTDVPSVPHSPHRAVRAALFAVVCVGVGATLHHAAGGCVTDWAAIGLALCVVWVSAWAGLAGERSWPALTAWLATAQLALHVLFTYADAGMSRVHTAAAAAAAIHSATPMPGMPGMAGMAQPQPAPYAAALTMITGHALAAVVCGWWLGQGERDFFALCRVVGALSAPPLQSVRRATAVLIAIRLFGVYEVPRRCGTTRHDGVKQQPEPLLTAVTFRGPPSFA
jgi:hypothetical protein